MRSSFWDDQTRVDDLKKLWASGLSASTIAKALGITSRCAIICKAQRLGLTARVSIPMKKTRPKFAEPRVVVVPRPKIEQVIDQPPALGPIGKSSPKGSCQYIYGDPHDPDWQMCAHPIVRGASYCAYHLHRCVTGQLQKRL
jgi:GcrA cell cycle regulator